MWHCTLSVTPLHSMNELSSRDLRKFQRGRRRQIASPGCDKEQDLPKHDTIDHIVTATSQPIQCKSTPVQMKEELKALDAEPASLSEDSPELAEVRLEDQNSVALRGAVLSVLRDPKSEQNFPDGVPIDAIARQVAATGEVDIENIRAVMEVLEADGDLYSTVTDDHFFATPTFGTEDF